MTLPIGARLGPYEILASLGAGGMGEVYRARDTRLDRDVAIKVLPESLARDAGALARFEREAKAVAALSHPNILAIHDLGTSDGITYAVMELLEGETLGQRLGEGPIPQRKALEIAREIALGLAAAHEKGIVHRDLKPQNLFLTADGRCKILDFGLARQLALQASDDTHSPTAAPATEPGTVLGTVGYMAPEQLRGQHADARSDIFSFGAVLYEMLSGRRAFRGETAIETMNAILKEDPPELSESGRALPPALERIVRHCLEKNPHERFQSARDLAFDLDALSNFSGQSAAYATVPGLRKISMRAWAFVAISAALLGAGLVAGRFLASRTGTREGVTFRRLTFRRGNVLSARFAPDGQTVVYGAAWEGQPGELFTVRIEGTESRPIGIPRADLLAISSKGEMAILLKKENLLQPGGGGTLARVPLGGGTPREVLEDVGLADWTPNGEELAVVRRAPNGKRQIEFPIGHAVYEADAIVNLRVSPKGDSVAFVERNAQGVATVVVLDRVGKHKKLSTGWRSVRGGLVWARAGDEILFNGGRSRGDLTIRGVTLSGRERVLLPHGGSLELHDMTPDGRLLLERVSSQSGLMCSVDGEKREREISWLDASAVRTISEDGKLILFEEVGEASTPDLGGVFLRKTDGTPAVRLGDGWPQDLTPDGKWALARAAGPAGGLVLLPTGVGSAKRLAVEGVEPLGGFALPGMKGFLIGARGQDRPIDLYTVGPGGGKPRRVPIDDLTWDAGGAISPDGERLVYVSKEGKLKFVPLSGGGGPRAVPNLTVDARDSPIQWSADGLSLFLRRLGELPARVERVDLATGKRELWKELSPSDSSGVTQITNIVMSRDARSYAYGYFRVVASDLYVVSGAR